MISIEETLTDLAVIQTTFETLDMFPDDQELRAEMMGIVTDARVNLADRIQELRSGPPESIDLQRFKDQILRMATLGMDRGWLDRLMKVEFFTAVAEEEVARTGDPFEPKFRYEFLPEQDLLQLRGLPPHLFMDRVFHDLQHAAMDDPNYASKFLFEKYVFQKFVAVMFALYANAMPRFDRPEYDH